MRKLMRLFFLFFSLTCKILSASLDIDVGAEAAILINAESGAVLYEKNADRVLYPASITKIATAHYALKVRGNKLDKLITAEQSSIASISEQEMIRSKYRLPSYWLTRGATHVGIKKKEQVTLKSLLFATLIASAGDASNIIAEYIGGTISQFMDLLNAYLLEIGCTNTHFTNPHGLHHPKHVTTAKDMARLTLIAMQNPTFCEIVKSVRYIKPKTNLQDEVMLIQTNRLLKRGKFYYSKAIGVKTGYTSKALNTLVAAAKNGDRTLILVFMKCKDKEQMYLDAKRVFIKAFEEKQKTLNLVKKGLQRAVLTLPKAEKAVKAFAKRSIKREFFPSEQPKIRGLLVWEKLQVPIKKGQKVATLHFKDQNGELVAKETLFAFEDVNFSVFFRIQTFLFDYKWALALIALCIGCIYYSLCLCLKGLR